LDNSQTKVQSLKYAKTANVPITRCTADVIAGQNWNRRNFGNAYVTIIKFGV